MTYQEKEILEKICKPYERSGEIKKPFKIEPNETRKRIEKTILALWDKMLKDSFEDIDNVCNAFDIMTEYFLTTSAQDAPNPFIGIDEDLFIYRKSLIINFLRQVTKLSVIYMNEEDAQREERKKGAQTAPNK